MKIGLLTQKGWNSMSEAGLVSIIKDYSAFRKEEIEDCCRKEESVIMDLLKQLSYCKIAHNFFIYGKTGCGKTALAKHLINHINQHSRAVTCVYVNCWKYNTSLGIYGKIAEALGGAISRRGRAVDEAFESVAEMIRKPLTPVLLILDEIDGLVQNKDLRILHNLTRSENILCSIICIANTKQILSKIDQRILESLQFMIINIPSFSEEQIFQILKKKAERALTVNSYDENILRGIAKIGNVRAALEIFLKTLLSAENKGKQKLSTEDIPVIDSYNQSETGEQIIIEILKEGEKTTSEIYDMFNGFRIRSKRQIRNYISRLSANKIIEIKSKGTENYVRLRETK